MPELSSPAERMVRAARYLLSRAQSPRPPTRAELADLAHVMLYGESSLTRAELAGLVDVGERRVSTVRGSYSDPELRGDPDADELVYVAGGRHGASLVQFREPVDNRQLTAFEGDPEAHPSRAARSPASPGTKRSTNVSCNGPARPLGAVPVDKPRPESSQDGDGTGRATGGPATGEVEALDVQRRAGDRRRPAQPASPGLERRGVAPSVVRELVGTADWAEALEWAAVFRRRLVSDRHLHRRRVTSKARLAEAVLYVRHALGGWDPAIRWFVAALNQQPDTGSAVPNSQGRMRAAMPSPAFFLALDAPRYVSAAWLLEGVQRGRWPGLLPSGAPGWTALSAQHRHREAELVGAELVDVARSIRNPAPAAHMPSGIPGRAALLMVERCEAPKLPPQALTVLEVFGPDLADSVVRMRHAAAGGRASAWRTLRYLDKVAELCGYRVESAA